MKRYQLYIIALFVAVISSSFVVSLNAQNQTRVMGGVKSSESGEPINGVAILVDNIAKGYSDADGRFSLILPREAEITFSHKDYNSKTIILDEVQELDIRLEERSVLIEDILITYQAKEMKLSVEETEIEVHGDYLIVNTKYHVPEKMFKTDFRFVAQPVLEDRTLDTTRTMRPVVIDGKMYDQKQYQWLGFGSQEDVLKPYIVENNITKENNIYSYRDSVFIGDTDPECVNEYYSHCYLALVSYREPPYMLDTVTIANGLVNPLQHFEYNLEPMQLDGTLLADSEQPYLAPTGADTIYIPAYELELQQVNGVARIVFGINSAKINYDDVETKEKIEEIKSYLDILQKDPDATIKSIAFCGYSSPEGIYSKNAKLAQQRTEAMQKAVLSSLDPSLLKYINLTADSKVEPWTSVADLADEEYPKLAATIREISDSYNGDYNKTNSKVVRLPEYRPIIIPRFLNELRRVTYNIDYSRYMPLPYDAIKKKYDSGGDLSRYEFYTMITNESDQSLLPKMESDALVAYPNFMIIANHKAVNMVREKGTDLSVLAPVIDKYAPKSVLYNQAALALMADSLELADSLIWSLGSIEDARYISAVADVLNGRADYAYPYFAEEESLNKVLLLLALRKDVEAMTLMSHLMEYPANQEKAKYCYVYAICANRNNNLTNSMMYLMQALTLDPAYDGIVRRDADLLDIYELVRYNLNSSSDGVGSGSSNL